MSILTPKIMKTLVKSPIGLRVVLSRMISIESIEKAVGRRAADQFIRSMEQNDIIVS